MADVELEEVIPLFGGHVVEMVAGVGGGVVDEDIDGAEVVYGGVDGGGDLGFDHEVCVVEVNFRVGVFILGIGFEGMALLGIFIEEGDVCALLEEAVDEGAADAICAAGDEDVFVFEVVEGGDHVGGILFGRWPDGYKAWECWYDSANAG